MATSRAGRYSLRGPRLATERTSRMRHSVRQGLHGLAHGGPHRPLACSYHGAGRVRSNVVRRNHDYVFLIVNGERGLTIARDAQEFCQTHGIQVRPRAPGHHARYIERRVAILRNAMPCS